MRALALGLCALLLVSCADGAPPPETWTVETGSAPTLLVLTDDDVYATSLGRGGAQVHRVDRMTGRQAAERTLAGVPNGLAVDGSGGLWAATVKLADQPSGSDLQELDGASLVTRGTVAGVRGEALSVAFADGSGWVGQADGVRPVSRARRVGELWPTAGPAYRLEPVDGDVLVTAGAALERRDGRDGTLLARVALPAAGSVVASVVGPNGWAVYPDEDARARLQRLAPDTLEPVGPAVVVGAAGTRLALTEDVLWLADPAGRLLCADPATGQVRRVVDVRTTGALAADERSVVLATPTGIVARPASC